MYGQSRDQRSVLIGQSPVTLSCPIVGDPYSASAYRTVSHNARADEALRVAPNAGYTGDPSGALGDAIRWHCGHLAFTATSGALPQRASPYNLRPCQRDG
jgi:hypothetical protein